MSFATRQTSMMPTVGTKLHVLMQKQNVSARTLAVFLSSRGEKSVSKSTINNWSNGKGAPGPEFLKGIADFFHLPVEYLANDGMSEPPKPEEDKEVKSKIQITLEGIVEFVGGAERAIELLRWANEYERHYGYILKRDGYLAQPGPKKILSPIADEGIPDPTKKQR